MGTHGDPWEPMGTHGDPWGPMDPHGNPWVPMGTHGDPWGPMGTHGNPWVPMGTHGDPWGPMGTHQSGTEWVGLPEYQNTKITRMEFIARIGWPRRRQCTRVSACLRDNIVPATLLAKLLTFEAHSPFAFAFLTINMSLNSLCLRLYN